MTDRERFLGIPEPTETRGEQLTRMVVVVVVAIVLALISKSVYIVCCAGTPTQ